MGLRLRIPSQIAIPGIRKLIKCKTTAVVQTSRKCSVANCDDVMNATTPHAQSATTKDNTVG